MGSVYSTGRRVCENDIPDNVVIYFRVLNPLVENIVNSSNRDYVSADKIRDLGESALRAGTVNFERFLNALFYTLAHKNKEEIKVLTAPSIILSRVCYPLLNATRENLECQEKLIDFICNINDTDIIMNYLGKVYDLEAAKYILETHGKKISPKDYSILKFYIGSVHEAVLFTSAVGIDIFESLDSIRLRFQCVPDKIKEKFSIDRITEVIQNLTYDE